MSLQAPTAQADPAMVEHSDQPDNPLPPYPLGWKSLARAFVQTARKYRGKTAMTDSLGTTLSYSDTLLRSIGLARALSKQLGDERNVGLLIPPSVPAAVANVSLALLGKVAVNLNYSASQELIDSSIDQAKVRHTVTSRKVLDKIKMKPKGEIIFLEDIPKSMTKLDKAWTGLVAKCLPIPLMSAFLPGLRNESHSNPATIIFTSGSTGDPKGVILTHGNILANVHQVNNQINLSEDERLLGILPFFHSFGYTINLWVVVCLGKMGIYHSNPLDAKIVGTLCDTHKATFLACSPTFARNFLQRCKPEQFSSLKNLLLGAEKLKLELADEIKATWNVGALEGYGCTETGPVVAVNVPNEVSIRGGKKRVGINRGTVGRLLPGTIVKTTDPDTGEDLPYGSVGAVWAKGPQVMAGYLGRPELTAKVLVDGWYMTGDLGFVNDEGFLTITGRIARFAKIAGEMVGHHAVELAISEATGAGEGSVVVISLPDLKRGEKLVVLYTDLNGLTPEEAVKKLNESTIPKLWIPSADCFIPVESIPILGTGKLDLRRLKELAIEQLCNT